MPLCDSNLINLILSLVNILWKVLLIYYENINIYENFPKYDNHSSFVWKYYSMLIYRKKSFKKEILNLTFIFYTCFIIHTQTKAKYSHFFR